MNRKPNPTLWPAVLLPVIADRLSKAAALSIPAGSSLPFIPGVISFKLARNTGAAFSFLSSSPVLTVVLTVTVMLALLIWLLASNELTKTMRTGLWLVLGGGLSNLYDRLSCGAVIDFIKLDFMHFAIFNVADIFVCCGAFLAVIAILISDRRKEKA